MKRILSIILMLFCIATAYSHNTEISYNKNVIILKDKSQDKRNFDFHLMENRFLDFLDLTPKKKNELYDITKSFNEKMHKASLIEDKTKKSDEIYKAINYELDNAKAILDSAQYDRFIKIFTVTLNNRGFFENISLKNIEKNV